ncbi:hypothetical protein JHK85_006514 [Glycine max]|nr:hypothetical protein JHK85_006514 [Glycine max]
MSSASSYDSDLHDEEMEMDFLRERLLKVEVEGLQRWWETLAEAAGISGLSVVRYCNLRREVGDKICLLAQHWREALREAAGILGDSVSDLGRGMLIAEKLIDLLVKHWRETLCEALCEAVGFSDGADLYYREIEMVYKIEQLVVNWSTALCEAAGGKFANEISLLMKHWREAHCEHSGIPLAFLLNFSVEEEIIRDFKDLMMSWKEALREAAGISRVVVLNYRMRARVENSTLKHRSLQDSDRHGTYMTSIAANRHVSQCTRSNIITTVNDVDADPLTWWFRSSSPSMLLGLQSFKHG